MVIHNLDLTKTHNLRYSIIVVNKMEDNSGFWIVYKNTIISVYIHQPAILH